MKEDKKYVVAKLKTAEIVVGECNHFENDFEIKNPLAIMLMRDGQIQYTGMFLGLSNKTNCELKSGDTMCYTLDVSEATINNYKQEYDTLNGNIPPQKKIIHPGSKIIDINNLKGK